MYRQVINTTNHTSQTKHQSTSRANSNSLLSEFVDMTGVSGCNAGTMLIPKLCGQAKQGAGGQVQVHTGRINMGLSENSVPLHPMVNDHYISLLNGYNWGYTPFSDIPVYSMRCKFSVCSVAFSNFPLRNSMSRQQNQPLTHAPKRVYKTLQTLIRAKQWKPFGTVETVTFWWKCK